MDAPMTTTSRPRGFEAGSSGGNTFPSAALINSCEEQRATALIVSRPDWGTSRESLPLSWRAQETSSMNALSGTACPEALRPSQPRAVTRGIITLAQEERFQLQDAEGVCRLFVLAHDAPLELVDLQALEKSGVPVRVEHGDAKGLVAAVAQDVEPLAS
jgi:hypothetical protein